jgi:hypothetical protein
MPRLMIQITGAVLNQPVRINGELTKLIFVLFAAIFPSLSYSAETLESLNRRRANLEKELERINSRISEIEGGREAEERGEKASTYFIKQFGIDTVNSAGGVEPYVIFVNPNAKNSIKYMYVTVALFNAVGDAISSSIDGQTTARLNFTGPLDFSQGEQRTDWGPVWYNTTAHCIRVQSLRVIYVNGKTLAFSGKTLINALAPEVANTCKLGKGDKS